MERDQARRVLGLNEGFTTTELDQAFRAQALKHHPDRGGQPAAMKQLVEARTTLTGPAPAVTSPSPSPSSANADPPPPAEPMDRISFTAVSLVLLVPVMILAALVIITVVVVSSAS